jgi:hypothetical protein
MGHRCGYVRVPEDHPWFGLDYGSEVPDPAPIPAEATVDDYGFAGMIAVLGGKEGVERLGRTVGGQLRVHGGITYAGERPGEDCGEGWWFGFDCAHSGDAPDPALMSESRREFEAEFPRGPDEVVRSTEYVANECKRLAEQLAAAQDPASEEAVK